MTGRSGVILRMPVCQHFFFCILLALTKFNHRNLRPRQRWYQDEKGQQKAGEQETDMKNVRAGSRLGHGDNIVVIDSLALPPCALIKGIARGEERKRQKQEHKDDRKGGTRAQVLEGITELHVEFHVITPAKLKQIFENERRTNNIEHRRKIDQMRQHKKRALALFSAPHLTQTGK